MNKIMQGEYQQVPSNWRSGLDTSKPRLRDGALPPDFTDDNVPVRKDGKGVCRAQGLPGRRRTRRVPDPRPEGGAKFKLKLAKAGVQIPPVGDPEAPGADWNLIP